MLIRHLVSLLVGLCAASALMPGSAFAQQPIRIGASISLPGTHAKPGIYGRDGYVLCQEQVNERGGLLGRKIELVLYEKLLTEDGKQVVVWPQDVAAGKVRFPTPPWEKR